MPTPHPPPTMRGRARIIPPGRGQMRGGRGSGNPIARPPSLVSQPTAPSSRAFPPPPKTIVGRGGTLRTQSDKPEPSEKTAVLSRSTSAVELTNKKPSVQPPARPSRPNFISKLSPRKKAAEEPVQPKKPAVPPRSRLLKSGDRASASTPQIIVPDKYKKNNPSTGTTAFVTASPGVWKIVYFIFFAYSKLYLLYLVVFVFFCFRKREIDLLLKLQLHNKDYQQILLYLNLIVAVTIYQKLNYLKRMDLLVHMEENRIITKMIKSIIDFQGLFIVFFLFLCDF